MDALDVVDWRRRVFATYAAVRADPDPACAHARWRDDRDDLFAHHPATPLLPEHRAAFTGLTVANILGVPFGTWLGQAYGWRATFWAVTVVGIAALAVIALFVPKDNQESTEGGSLSRRS